MNRKLVNGLLLLSVATVGCGTFTSCKDTDEDFKNEIILSQDELAKKLIAYINEHKCDCPDNCRELLEAVEAFLNNPKADGKMSSAVLSLIDGTLEQTFGSDYTSWKGNVVMKGYLETKLEDYVKKGEIEVDLSGYVKDDDTYKQLGKDIAALLKWQGEVGEWQGEADENIAAALAQAKTAYMTALEANNAIMDLIPLLEERLGNIETTIDQISELVNTLETSLTSLQLELKKLQPQIDAINQRLNKLITNILIQQTYNPMFGSINLPIGLQSNINANYYGYIDGTISFPFGATEYNGNNSVLENDAIQDAIKKLGYKAENFSGYYMADDNNANLGNIYLTINPNTVDFSGVKLAIVNSKDDLAPVAELKAVKENDKILDFGFDLTRSAENNGLYRVPVNVTAENAPKLAIHIESGLKSAMKDALLDRTKSDFVELGKVLLRQMNGFLPAYGVKSSWTTTDENGVETEHSVYSNYNLAVATVRPLGYEFLYGEGTNKEIPTFGSVKDALHDFFKDIRKDMVFNLDLQGVSGLKPEDINISLENVKLEIKPTQIVIDLTGTPIKVGGADGVIEGEGAIITLGYNGKEVSSLGNADALNPLINQIVKSVNDLLTGKGDNSLTNQLNKQIREQIVGKVNDMVADINKMLVGDGTPENPGINNQINDQIGTILDKIENQLAGKLDRVDKLVDKYNALANKINRFLKNPNNYLQVMMAYSDGNGSLHHLSTTLTDPSRFVQGSGNAIELYPTSYTAELIAPSFKKYLAITRAFRGTTPVAINAKTVSENAGLNQVIPGRQQRVALKANALEKGLTYEIVYTSLDYRGYTSTRLYYLTVK